MGGMKGHAADRGELVKVDIVAYHRRSVDDHRAAVHNAKAITNLGIPFNAYLMSNIDPTRRHFDNRHQKRKRKPTSKMPAIHIRRRLALLLPVIR